MKNSAQRIRTSHVGRLPVPSGFEETALRLARGEISGEEVAAQVVPIAALKQSSWRRVAAVPLVLMGPSAPSPAYRASGRACRHAATWSK
jgi:hypothetical protein